MKHLLVSVATVLMLLITVNANANNLQISNVSKASINMTDDCLMIQFDISWDNSWRTSTAPYNWDATWLFVKYRIDGGEWQHASLNITGSNHTAPAGSTIYGVTDGTGVFIYRSANGTGTNTWTSTQLRWEYGTDGVADNAENIEIKIIGIEMVYIPQGSFYLGSGGNENNHFYEYPTTANPYIVSSENAVTVGTANGNLYYTSDNSYAGDQTGPIPADFPKGYDSFYCMKYEITQGQYAEFLNLLTATQADNRYYSTTSYRYTISGTHPNFTAGAEDRACNYLSWADGTAYCDWSGLRPMSEPEFVKACRGPETPVVNEFAWGNTNIASSAYTLENNNTANEGIATNYSVTEGNISYSTTDGSINGPLRVGIFAAHPDNSGRTTSGAAYYGIMEMSGNLWERCVTVGNPAGRSFTGANGDGALTTDGNANMTNCPDETGLGSGFLGGDWDYYSYVDCTSDRNYAG